MLTPPAPPGASAARPGVRPTGQSSHNLAIARDVGSGTPLARLAGMPVAHEMRIVTMNDIGLYAESHAVARLVRDAATAAAGLEPALVERFRYVAATLTAAVAEALCPPDDGYALRRLRHTGMLLEELRRQAYQLYRADALSAPMFDEVMRGTMRCRREADDLRHVLRHRAMWRGQGIEIDDGA
jgi:hypothetical protein